MSQVNNRVSTTLPWVILLITTIICSCNADSNGICPQFSIPNGAVTQQGSLIGMNATLVCDRGYRIDGTQHYTCSLLRNNGRWIGDQYCVPIPTYCRHLIVENGDSTTYSRGLSLGSIATFSCAPGYALTGDMNFHCLEHSATHGLWSGRQFCKVVDNYCSADLTVDNGTVEYSNGCRILSEGVVTCNDGFELSLGEPHQCLQHNATHGQWYGTRTCIDGRKTSLRLTRHLHLGKVWLAIIAAAGSMAGVVFFVCLIMLVRTYTSGGTRRKSGKAELPLDPDDMVPFPASTSGISIQLSQVALSQVLHAKAYECDDLGRKSSIPAVASGLSYGPTAPVASRADSVKQIRGWSVYWPDPTSVQYVNTTGPNGYTANMDACADAITGAALAQSPDEKPPISSGCAVNTGAQTREVSGGGMRAISIPGTSSGLCRQCTEPRGEVYGGTAHTPEDNFSPLQSLDADAYLMPVDAEMKSANVALDLEMKSANAADSGTEKGIANRSYLPPLHLSDNLKHAAPANSIQATFKALVRSGKNPLRHVFPSEFGLKRGQKWTPAPQKNGATVDGGRAGPGHPCNNGDVEKKILTVTQSGDSFEETQDTCAQMLEFSRCNTAEQKNARGDGSSDVRSQQLPAEVFHPKYAVLEQDLCRNIDGIVVDARTRSRTASGRSHGAVQFQSTVLPQVPTIQHTADPDVNILNERTEDMNTETTDNGACISRCRPTAQTQFQTSQDEMLPVGQLHNSPSQCSSLFDDSDARDSSNAWV
ncbi:uncharacterized protein LOC135815180 [Sycon ciliatum]|uniref:uncharacterized protein LOC135815180 n=1 Tax=Sycon ciliatum TaxID=27933 RepID=UPI0031F5FD6E